jgi:hypothetical protein
MRHDPIARAHAQLGTAKRQRDHAREAIADTLADLEAALSIICRLPDTPERTALYGLIEARAARLRRLRKHEKAPG